MCWEAISDTECRVYIKQAVEPRGAKAMLGFAENFRRLKKTSEWMQELREGESE